MAKTYDVIVSGARCAGSPTAMLLARKGYRVLLVDRATFPSDTVSTHLVHPPGIDALTRWGLLERLAATGCPAITTYTSDFGRIVLSGSPGTAYGPRRIVLDKLLIDAAAEAGVEVREAFTVDDVVIEDGSVTGIQGHGPNGGRVIERAHIVVGADGKHSRVARAVGAPMYHERPMAEGLYYAYWSGVPTSGFEIYIRPARAMVTFPTHNDQTLVLVAWPASEFPSFRADVENNFLETLDLVPPLRDRVRAGVRESRFHASGDHPGFFRRPYGPGWALVGDAGYTIDPSTGQGISDAFNDAERLADALDDALSGRRRYDHALADLHRHRDEQALPMYEFTFQLAGLAPRPPALDQILAAAVGNKAAMDSCARMFAGVLPVPEFFSPGHLARIMQAATV